jgi:hypothetical protein
MNNNNSNNNGNDAQKEIAELEQPGGRARG